MRAVSLVPSMTETLLAWGIEPVACTRFCEQPELPHVGGTKDPDIAAILALEPDLVIMDSEENRREDLDELASAGVVVHTLSIRSIDDVDAQLVPLADRLGVGWTGTNLTPLAEGTDERRRAFVPIWKRPMMALGSPTYATSLLRAIGIDNVCADLGSYPIIEASAAAALEPDLVIATSEPYPWAERHRELLETIAPAVFIDGKDLFWWGARTAPARERLRSLTT